MTIQNNGFWIFLFCQVIFFFIPNTIFDHTTKNIRKIEFFEFLKFFSELNDLNWNIKDSIIKLREYNWNMICVHETVNFHHRLICNLQFQDEIRRNVQLGSWGKGTLYLHRYLTEECVEYDRKCEKITKTDWYSKIFKQIIEKKTFLTSTKRSDNWTLWASFSQLFVWKSCCINQFL